MLFAVVSALAFSSAAGLLNNGNVRSRSMRLNQKGTGFNYDPSNYKDSNSGENRVIHLKEIG